ncbi:MAG: hypothetical protein ACRDOI_10225 [Trebonia sp.]
METAPAVAGRRAVLAAAREITATSRDLEARWTPRLRAADTVVPPGGGMAEASFLAPGGGYRIPPGRSGELGDAAAAFPGLRAAPDGWAYMRDFGYYAADAAMYLPGRVPPAWQRWDLVAARWPRHGDLAAPMAALAAEPPVPWCRWLAWLSYLEAVCGDLCTAAWSASCLADTAAAGLAGDALGQVCGVLAEAGWHWWTDPGRAASRTWAARLLAVTADPALDALFGGLADRLRACSAPPWTVRAIREGDAFWQVAAAFEAWWESLRTAHPGSRFLLVSEAFGAMTAGPLWAGMMPAADRAATGLAVSRMSVHEEEMGRVPACAWRTPGIPAGGSVVVHLDDSVFTGRTHTALRRALAGRPAAVYLAALTLDVGTPLNHPEEITALGRNVADHMADITTLARSPRGLLPPAPSMWARRKRPSEDPAGRILGGSDRLLAALWHRYAPEITHA